MTEQPVFIEHLTACIKRSLQHLRQQQPFFQLEQRVVQMPAPLPLAQLMQQPARCLLPEICLANQNQLHAHAFEAQLAACQTSPCLALWIESCFHGGSPALLRQARQHQRETYLIAQDWIVDEYQILQARLADADAVVFSPALLGSRRTQAYCQKARFWQLEPVLLIHHPRDLSLARELQLQCVCLSAAPGQTALWQAQRLEQYTALLQGFSLAFFRSDQAADLQLAQQHKLRPWLAGDLLWRAADAPEQIAALQQSLASSP
ncbi:MAG: hypothetical protein IGS03_07725 [Candidatus Sericytochromatia bacterium]|nr:hypothetical protein [Candidatus Sericytochromatia bacterium]